MRTTVDNMKYRNMRAWFSEHAVEIYFVIEQNILWQRTLENKGFFDIL